MRTVEHLTKEQLAAYAARSPQLARSGTDEIEIHLLQCAACRDLMPAPTPEQFWSALLDETEFDESFETKNPPPARSPFSSAFSFFRQPLAWGALVLIVAAGISFLIWLSVNRDEEFNDNREIAQITKGREVENNPAVTTALPTLERGELLDNRSHQSQIRLQGDAKKAQLSKSTSIFQSAQQAEIRTRISKMSAENGRSGTNKKPSQTPRTSNSERNNVIVSTSRSLSDCPPEVLGIIQSPYFEIIKENRPILRWKAVPKALKYQLYISDSSNILIEKSETTDQTSYRLQTELEVNKSYKWKVIAILPGSKILSSEPISFTIGGRNQKYSPNKIDKMNVNPTRCLQESTETKP